MYSEGENASGSDQWVAQYVERRWIIWMIGPEWALGGDPQGVVHGALIRPPFIVPEDNQSGVIRACRRYFQDGGIRRIKWLSRINGWK